MSEYKLIYCGALKARGGESVSCGELYYGELHQCRECSKKDIAELIAENERHKAELLRMTAQHNDLVLRNKVLRERPDLPPERIQCHDQVMTVQAENESLQEEIATDNKIIAERDRLLSMFECPAHGQCVPYAMEQVEALRKDAERYRWLRNTAEPSDWEYISHQQPDVVDIEVDASMIKELKG